MNKDQVLGIIRHALTFVGGVLITKGLLEPGMVTEIVGSAVSLIGAIWSVVAKTK